MPTARSLTCMRARAPQAGDRARMAAALTGLARKTPRVHMLEYTCSSTHARVHMGACTEPAAGDVLGPRAAEPGPCRLIARHPHSLGRAPGPLGRLSDDG